MPVESRQLQRLQPRIPPKHLGAAAGGCAPQPAHRAVLPRDKLELAPRFSTAGLVCFVNGDDSCGLHTQRHARSVRRRHIIRIDDAQRGTGRESLPIVADSRPTLYHLAALCVLTLPQPGAWHLW